MISSEIRRSIKALSKFDLVVNHYNLALTNSLEGPPSIEFDRTSYPGFEAHLFTIADASQWMPELDSEDNVILYGIDNRSDPFFLWIRFLEIANEVMRYLENYRHELKHGIYPSTDWAYNENRWYRKNWEGPNHRFKPTEEFLNSVDESIREQIKALNDLGFSTTQSCSGLEKDHPDREPYLPYVMFDERAYKRSSAHLFTLADITGWVPSYGPHNFDIEFRLHDSKRAEELWDKLVVVARRLAQLLEDYRLNLKQELVEQIA